jgi:hypothetical protein
MADEKAREVAIALSQNLIVCRASARTPISVKGDLSGDLKRVIMPQTENIS